MTDQPHPNLPRTWRPGLVLALPLSLLALAACDAEEVETLDEVGELDVTLEPSGEPGPTSSIEASPGFVLALTGPPTDAPVLRELANELDMLDATQLDIDELAEAVADSEAIAIDLALVRPEQLDAWSPVFEAAREARVPILFDRANDAGVMAQALGFGVEADAVLAESLAPTSGYRLRTFGGLIEVDTAEEQRDVADFALDDAAEPEPDPGLVDLGPDELDSPSSEFIADAILDRLDTLAANGDAVPYSGSLPPGSHAHYEILTDETWEPWSVEYVSQDATMEVDFSIDLYAASNSDDKYLVITPMGGGVNPGTLRYNDDDRRGYFVEQLEVLVRPEHEGLQAFKHAPLTDNVSSTFTTSTNMNVGATASYPPGVDVGFSQGTSASVTLSSFGVIDQSTGLDSHWLFRMTATGDGHEYDDYKDLVDSDPFDPDLRSLPALAKSTVVPSFETVYSADEYFENIVRQQIEYKATLRYTWITGSWPAFTGHSQTTSKKLIRPLAIDFGTVARPHDGTLRFDEMWSGSPIPDRWDPPVQEGSENSTLWTIAANNHVEQTGDAHGYDGNGVPRGAYLEAHASYFSQGSLSVAVYPSDNDTWGVMYSIQDAQNYYRAEIDKQRNFARIVKIAGSQYTVLATVPLVGVGAPPFAQSVWHDLRIVRQGVAHHLYLDGDHMLTAYDNVPFGTGSVALYSWGMSKVYFGKVRVRRPYEPNRNLAYGRPTLQSSTFPGFGSNNAVDGSTVGAASMCLAAAGSYWRVDLQSTRKIDEVVIWGAMSPEFRIEVLDENMNVVTSRLQGANMPAHKATYAMGGVQGRYVRITSQGLPKILGFHEVEVYGPTE